MNYLDKAGLNALWAKIKNEYVSVKGGVISGDITLDGIDTGSLIVRGASRFIGAVYAPTFTGNLVGNASTATKATQDADGNVFTSTYATKTQLTNGSVTKVGTSTVGGTTTPIYLKDGVPTALSYTIAKSVPSNAVFTDTWRPVVNNLTSDSTDSSLSAAQGKALKALIDALPTPMQFKGSLGTGGTITSLPTASASNEGYTYKVITNGTYASQAAKIGDVFISNGTAWVLVPSGDEPSGTVTSVGVSVPTGLSVSNTPITTSGTIAISLASGYSIPTTTKQATWDAKQDAITTSNKLAYSLISGTPTSLPANGGTSTTTNRANIIDVRGAQRLPSYFTEKSATLWFNNSGTPSSDWYSGIHLKGWTAGYQSWELVSGSSIGLNGNLYYRNGIDDTWQDWKRIAFASEIPTSLPASDVYAWAKAANKPSYHAGELNITPTSYKVTSVAAGIAPYISDIGTNIFSGATTNEITVERSTDDGASWTDVTTSEAANIKNVFSGCVQGSLPISSRSKAVVGDKMRITFNPSGSSRYCQLAFIYIYFNTAGCGCTCNIEKNLYTDKNAWTAYVSDAPIAGWSGPNIIGMGGTIFGQGDSRNNGYGIRMTFRINSVNADYDSRGYIYTIQGFTSNKAWGLPSGNSIAAGNRAYKFTNADRAVQFDNAVGINGAFSGATTGSFSSNVTIGGTLSVTGAITGSLNGNASSATKLATSRTLWGQSFNGTANVSGDMTGVGSITASGNIQSTKGVSALGIASLDVSSATGSIYVTGIRLGSSTNTLIPSDGIVTLTTATSSADGIMSKTDKAKLDGIASGATANVGTVTSVSVSMNQTTVGTITTSGDIDLGMVVRPSELDGYTKKCAVTNTSVSSANVVLDRITDGPTYQICTMSSSTATWRIYNTVPSGQTVRYGYPRYVRITNSTSDTHTISINFTNVCGPKTFSLAAGKSVEVRIFEPADGVTPTAVWSQAEL